MAQIRMSESELLDLQKNTQRQQRNVQDVTTAGNTAVGAAGSEWASSAFDSFKDVWAKHKTFLNGLDGELGDMQRVLVQHAGVAQQVNRPFA